MSKSIYGMMKIYNLITLCSLDANVAKSLLQMRNVLLHVQKTLSQLSTVLLSKSVDSYWTITLPCAIRIWKRLHAPVFENILILPNKCAQFSTN
jgi:hypothetical protein